MKAPSAVSVEAAGETYTDDAFVTVRRARTPAIPVEPTQLEAAPGARFTVTPTMMWLGLTGSALGFLFVLLGAFGVLDKGNRTSVEDRVAAYSRKSKARKEAAKAIQNPQGMSAQAVDIAKRALESNKGLEASLGARLEAAGMQIKPAEWLLAHFGAAFAAGLLGLLLWSGSIVVGDHRRFPRRLGAMGLLGLQKKPPSEGIQDAAGRHAPTDVRQLVGWPFASAVSRHCCAGRFRADFCRVSTRIGRDPPGRGDR